MGRSNYSPKVFYLLFVRLLVAQLVAMGICEAWCCAGFFRKAFICESDKRFDVAQTRVFARFLSKRERLTT